MATTTDRFSTSGPLSRPSSTTWRRQRLLRIGSNSSVSEGNNFPRSQTVDESTALRATTVPTATTISSTGATAGPNIPSSYGTLPSSRFRLLHTTPFHRRLPSLLDITLPRTHFFSASTPASPTPSSPSYFRRVNQRSISAYDAPLGPQPDQIDKEVESDAKTNGIRVWYSSFSSIDWLHDAIKDSVRFSRLRRRKSLRARIRLAFDKSIGWWIVTIVGFLTSVVAFLVVRSEQWLFDIKEGYCHENVWKAKRLCCPMRDESPVTSPNFLNSHITTDNCVAWQTWSQVFGPAAWTNLEPVIEYVAYAIVAVSDPMLFHLSPVSQCPLHSSLWQLHPVCLQYT
jgi:chloride channel 3/4/5